MVSFLLQPLGRQAWASAPTLAELRQPTPTRAALDRVMGERADERVLSLSTGWPQARARDLAWANWASFSGHRNANGYDPLVPAERLVALGGMRPDGTVTRALLESDPGRLELLGVRWVQVPTGALAVPADADGLGRAARRGARAPAPGLFALPITRATELRFSSFLSGAVEVEDGARGRGVRRAARLRARDRASDPRRTRDGGMGLGPPRRAGARPPRAAEACSPPSRRGWA